MREKISVDDIKDRFGDEAWFKAMMLAPGNTFVIEIGRKRFEIQRWYPCWDYLVTAH